MVFHLLVRSVLYSPALQVPGHLLLSVQWHIYIRLYHFPQRKLQHRCMYLKSHRYIFLLLLVPYLLQSTAHFLFPHRKLLSVQNVFAFLLQVHLLSYKLHQEVSVLHLLSLFLLPKVWLQPGCFAPHFLTDILMPVFLKAFPYEPRHETSYWKGFWPGQSGWHVSHEDHSRHKGLLPEILPGESLL